METLYEDEQLRISFEPGTSHTSAIVAFAGFAFGLGGIEREEFARTLSDERISHDVYFVVEKARSFYNVTFDKICDVLTPRLPLGKTYLLGNSAGGFGALFFDTIFSARKSTIAFVPLFSVKPNGCINEMRHRESIEKVPYWRIDHVPASNGARRFIFFGEKDPDDVPHAMYFRKLADANARVYRVAGCGHDVAIYLHSIYGALRPVVDLIVNHDASHDDVSELLRHLGVPLIDD